MTVSFTTTVKPQPGSLVHARGRDWVGLSSGDPDQVRLRPLTGGTEEISG